VEPWLKDLRGFTVNPSIMEEIYLEHNCSGYEHGHSVNPWQHTFDTSDPDLSHVVEIAQVHLMEQHKWR